ncbi:hypothetical protein ADUPG1_007884 [Aduncisulcus paluster]|uniref:Uncharacterized protein n=1 Tax=Aduncisulcus paluster TaxID=2918883 RepID=A0ABQ5KRD5_9EUKA|nr:hypothetical protein ADUPG1_007884 [Aduncisulcus paluster]
MSRSVKIVLAGFEDHSIEPVFIHRGFIGSIPIPRDSPTVQPPSIAGIEGRNENFEKSDERYDLSSNAQKMITQPFITSEKYTHISIPFESSVPIKGAYIYDQDHGQYLTLTLTSSKREKISKKYAPTLGESSWYFLPIGLSDVIRCEITGQGWLQGLQGVDRDFSLQSLFFVREETPEEFDTRVAKEKVLEELWAEASLEKIQLIQKERKPRRPIPVNFTPSKVLPSFLAVKATDEAVCKGSDGYDISSKVQAMLREENFGVLLSHISIPFPTPSTLKGAYICTHKNFGSPSLLFTFTDCDGKKTYKKYDFTRPESWEFEWDFLPIDLDNVVLCEVQGKGTWFDKYSRNFLISSLMFSSANVGEQCVQDMQRLAEIAMQLIMGTVLSEDSSESE